MAMFVHFGMNTFTGKEWGDGTDNPALFAPATVDVQQWVALAKQAGFSCIILTAKHHDGFCLWPSRYTKYSVAQSPYKSGSGNIVNELAAACSQHGIKFGFYLSPWDRHESTYGSKAYNAYYTSQLSELLVENGNVCEAWFDGANGEGPNGRVQAYNWDLYYATVRHFQPEALIAISGPDIRWIGNESGTGSDTEWCVQPRAFSMQQAAFGDRVWYPSECDVSIRPGWFYHPEEDAKVKSVDELTELYLHTVGKNSNLLLNVPPNAHGRISDVDVQRLLSWRQNLDQIFANNVFRGQSITASNVREKSVNYSPSNCLDQNRETFWAADRDTTRAELTITLSDSTWINIVRLEEAIEYGQRITSFRVLYEMGNNWIQSFQGATVGRSRIAVFPPVRAKRIKICIDAALAAPTLRIVNGYYSTLVQY